MSPLLATNIVHLIESTTGIKLYSYQKQAIDSVTKNKRSVYLKARQLGFTTLAVHYISAFASLNPNKNIIVFSFNRSNVRLLKDKVVNLLKCYNTLSEWNFSDSIGLLNGTRIDFLIYNPLLLHGRTIDLIVLDEFAFFREKESLFEHLLPRTEKLLAYTSVPYEVEARKWLRTIEVETISYSSNENSSLESVSNLYNLLGKELFNREYRCCLD